MSGLKKIAFMGFACVISAASAIAGGSPPPSRLEARPGEVLELEAIASFEEGEYPFTCPPDTTLTSQASPTSTSVYCVDSESRTQGLHVEWRGNDVKVVGYRDGEKNGIDVVIFRPRALVSALTYWEMGEQVKRRQIWTGKNQTLTFDRIIGEVHAYEVMYNPDTGVRISEGKMALKKFQRGLWFYYDDQGQISDVCNYAPKQEIRCGLKGVPPTDQEIADYVEGN